MTVKDLLDQIVGNADDDDGDYRTACLRWLNLCRQEAYGEHTWRTAIDPAATITTAAAQTDGLYELDDHEHIVGNRMWDETNENTITHESFGDANSIDDNKQTTGEPHWFSDAGVENSTSGDRQIYLWPIPEGAFTIRFAGYRKYKDILSSEESLAVDPIFGEIGPWGAAFAAGMRYYHDLDDNENPAQIMMQEKRWTKLMKKRRNRSDVAPNTGMSLSDVRHRARVTTGRFNPSHFNNRG